MTEEHITTEAAIRRMFIRYFAQSSEPVEWELEKNGPEYTVTAKVPVVIRRLFARYDVVI